MSAADAQAAPVYLIDASIYVFRAWHTMPDEFRDSEGWPTNAVQGFARFLFDVLERERPQHIAVAFDEALDSCFRNRLYPAYKANRDPAPEELKRQFAHCKALCAALGLSVLRHDDYEADDLIGTALTRARADGHRGIILSADKDLSQLLHAGDEQWDYARNQRWGAHGVKARHGVEAHQIADYLALCGAPSTTFPACPASARRPPPCCSRISAISTACCAASTKYRSCASAAPRRPQRSCANTATTPCSSASSPRSPAMHRWTARIRASRDSPPMPMRSAPCARRCASDR